MNICLVTLEWPPYGCGIATYMFNLARGLVELGHNVTVITNDKQPLSCSGVKIVQVRVTDAKSRLIDKLVKWRMEPYHSWSLAAYKKFQQLCENENFDIIETAEFGACARHFMKNRKVPVVVRCHNPTHVVWSINQRSPESYRMPLWLYFQDRQERKQTYKADAIVSPSYALANHLSLTWVIPRSRFTVLPNPIDTELFDSNGQADEDKNEILYVGRLDFNKGCFDLIESVEPLLKKYPRLSLRMLGSDSPAVQRSNGKVKMASEVIRASLPSQYHDRVIFTDHVPVVDVVRYQQKALCTVMPTRGFESFSYTTIEPMSCRCPVIATHCGGPSEIITDSVDGLLVSPGDIKQMTVALERLVTDMGLRKRLAANARQTVQRRFAIEVVVGQIVRFYETAIRNYRNGN